MLLVHKALHLLYPSSFLHSISFLQPQSLFFCPSKCLLDIHVLSVSMASSPVHLLLREELALTIAQLCNVKVSSSSADISSSPTLCLIVLWAHPFLHSATFADRSHCSQNSNYLVQNVTQSLCTCSSGTVSLSPKLWKFFVLFPYSSSKIVILFSPRFCFIPLPCYQQLFHRPKLSSFSF